MRVLFAGARCSVHAVVVAAVVVVVFVLNFTHEADPVIFKPPVPCSSNTVRGIASFVAWF